MRRLSRRVRQTHAEDSGLSLIELLLAAALTAIVGAMALMWLFSVNRTATDFTAEQQAENDLRRILELAVGEVADMQPPARCDDDPAPSDVASCTAWVVNWDGSTFAMPIYTATASTLCFYALAPAGSPPDPSSTGPPQLEGRCIKVNGDRLEVETAPVTYSTEFAQDPPMAGSLTLERVLGYGLDGTGVFSYREFDGDAFTQPPKLQDVASIEITLTHRDVTVRPNAEARHMSATLAVRANRFSPFQTPLYPRPDQVLGLTLTVADDEMEITVDWVAPGTGGPPAEYHIRWKSGTEAYTDDPSDERYEVVDNATTYTITGLTNGTTYTVEVRAKNPVGFGAVSEQTVTATTTTTTTMPVTSTT